MSDLAIRVENLGKRYQLGQRDPYKTLRESLSGIWQAPLRRLQNRAASEESLFWALRDVSFEVKRGEVVGIIGRNGAGKSTLLKILSRITGLTTGRIEIHGRVGSLLEVGTGFHPELTGRENIFMNGAILGMRRAEVKRKFDEIVAFSEVEKFIDTPVKHYSSGMYTRLAFSVAAHMEPEILIVDEVLAVGDMAFQQKCLGKMNEVAHAGRTVLFVSHNMAAVETLCSRAILLNQGLVEFDGSQTDGVRHYYDAGQETSVEGVYIADEASLRNARAPRIAKATVTAEPDYKNGQFPIGAPLVFEVQCACPNESVMPSLGIAIENKRGVRIVTLHSKCAPHLLARSAPGMVSFVCRVPKLALAPGQYVVKLGWDDDGEVGELVENALTFTVLPSDYFGNSGKRVGGVVLCEQEWRMVPPSESLPASDRADREVRREGAENEYVEMAPRRA